MLRRYFDNAATSFPKPPRVLDAMSHYLAANGAPARGQYAEARAAGQALHTCRLRINELLHGESPDHVIFGHNTTDGLNLAIHGVVRRHRRLRPAARLHAVTTALDHNSVLRVFAALADELNGPPHGLEAHAHRHHAPSSAGPHAAHAAHARHDSGPAFEATVVPVDPETGLVSPHDVAEAMRPETVLVALNHASNVTGTVQPAAEIGALCRARGVAFVLDAAQSLGHVQVDARALHADFIAFPGHKGLLGPTGTGGLYIRPGAEHLLDPVRQGGTGSRSEADVQPAALPDRFEPGSHNTVGLIGLSEGVAWLLERGLAAVRTHELTLIERMIAVLDDPARVPGLQWLGPRRPGQRVGVFSVLHDRLAPAQLSAALEDRFGVLTRAGLHCAPHAHRAFTASAGATRFSLGPFLTVDDVDFAMDALSTLCREASAGPVVSAPQRQAAPAH